MHTDLTMFLNIHSILCERQLGFQHNHSATHALLEITENIKQVCGSGKYAWRVFLDLQSF